MLEDDELLTVAEVARRLRVNPQTVRNWVGQEKLAAIRVGQRRVRIRRSDLEAFVEHRGAGRSLDAAREGGAEQQATTAGSWRAFAIAMAEATARLAAGDPGELVPALYAVADSARRLADLLADDAPTQDQPPASDAA